MIGEHEGDAVSRRRFLRQSAVAAAALGARSLLAPGEPRAVDASGPLSPLQPPPDELLITIQQSNTSSTIHGSALAGLTGVLNTILGPIGWTLRTLPQANGSRVIMFQGRVAGGPTTTYTVIRYQNVNGGAQSHSALLATATILAAS